MIQEFDPNSVGNKECGVFGLPFNAETASTVILPVPWDVTTSYTSGSHDGPRGILEASYQVDLFHSDFPDVWKEGIAMLPISQEWLSQNKGLRQKAETLIQAQETGQKIEDSSALLKELDVINRQSEKLNDWVEAQTLYWLEKGKRVGVLGGDHSVPLGYLRALSKKYTSFGILHIDAHMDLREKYEGFIYSHASIMFNALKLNAVSRLVQVGIRDYCQEENDLVLNSKGRIKVFTDKENRHYLYGGKSFESLCKKIIHALPDTVYLSVDIDGLDPSLCPNTGTPVPGGLHFQELCYLLNMLSKSGKRLIGFDLVEVSPGQQDQWDANVGARLLYVLFGTLSKMS